MTESPAQRGTDVRFIKETATAKDELKSHARLANAVAEALMADDELRVVGLFGEWGSGKSTVVKLLEERLTPQKVRFFTYDAWIHQSDTPRRAFLEELLRFLEKEDLRAFDLQGELDKILGKTERTETTTTPSVPLWVGFVLAAVALAPLGFQFLRTDWAEWMTFGYYDVAGEKLGALYVWAAALALVPFAILMGANLLRLGRRMFLGDSDPDRLVALLANKITEVRTDVKTKDPEPTSLEFQRFLRRVLAVYSRQTADRLLFVVDNLDRLPDAEMLSLWSTIRGLFHGEPSRGEANVRIPTVLLPIDEAAILRLHKTKDDDRTVAADGFIAKTFDVVFRVPTPVLSRWHSYLDRRLEDVFPRHYDPDWTGIAARVLEETSVETRTPRSLNAFVNQLATLWLQWRHEGVSFAAMCFYAAQPRLADQTLWSALQTPRPWMFEFDQDWMRGVAAMRFGAELDVAGQILIEAPLRKALADEDEATFDVLAKREGFTTVLRRLCEEYRHATGAPDSQTVRLLGRLPSTGDANTRLAWAAMIDRMTNMLEWRPATERDVAALGALLEQATPQQRARLVAAVPDKIMQFTPEAFADAAPSVLDAMTIVAAASDAGLPQRVARLPPGYAPVIAICEAAGADPSSLALFQPQIEPQALVEELGQQLISGKTPWKRFEPIVTALMSWPLSLPWSVLVERAAGMLREQPSDRSNDALEALLLTWRLAPDARTSIAVFATSSIFQDLTIGNIAAPNGDTAFVRLLALAIAADAPLAEDLEHRLHAANKMNLLRAVEARLDKLAPEVRIHELILRAAAQPKAAGVFAQLIAQRLARTPDAVSPTSPATHASAYASLPEKLANHVWRTVRRSEWFWLAVEKPAGEDVEARRAIRAVLSLPDTAASDRVRGAAAMRKLLKRVDAQGWKRDVESGEGLADLALLSNNARLMAGDLRLGLERLIHPLVTTGDLSLARRWFAAAEHLPKDKRKSLGGHLARRLLHSDTVAAFEILQLGSHVLFESGAFKPKATEFAIRFLNSGFGDEARIAWLVQNLGELQHIVGAASPERQAVLKGRLAKQIETAKGSATHIANLHLLHDMAASQPRGPATTA